MLDVSPGGHMDPVTIGIGALSKIIGLGIKGWNALDDQDFNKEDVEALRALLDAGASASAKRKTAAPGAGALQLALIARAFGQAVGRHQEFHGKLLLTGGLRRSLNRSDREREAEIKLRVQLAALKVRELGNDPRGEIDLIASLTEHPLATPYYRSLWRAFSDPGLTIEEAGEEPPLVMTNTARREFERYFLLAYLAGSAAATGRAIGEYLEGLKQYRQLLVRDLLVENLATWGGCHVFGNVPRERWSEDGDRDGDDGIPFMPLEDVYVEPSGIVERDVMGPFEYREELLGLIEQLVAPSAPAKTVVVAADFGSGKSLSARMLARRWAEQLLSSHSGSLDLPLPIHVRCAEDFPSEQVDLELTLRRAWKRQANSFGYSVSDEDEAFSWPSSEQRAVCMLDGLDEVALGEQHLKTLFQKLGAKTSRNHRFVIFSRPGALPARRDLGDDVVMVRVEPFEARQIEQWLGKWGQLRLKHPVITLQDLQVRNLATVAQTPILLFMVACTWNKHATGAEPPSRAEIYEYFFYQVAKGKAEADREQHGPIASASEQLLAALQNARVLDESAEPPDAMLWLMGRVAWEAHMLEQRFQPQTLTRRHIDNLLQDGEVPLPSGAADAIRIGLILALQADLHSANHTILFGHQSFREFLVGRHWALLLQRIVRSSGRADRLTASLLGGRLLDHNDKSFAFLMELVNTKTATKKLASPLSWSDRERELLIHWAQETFEDERQEFGEHGRTNSRTDSILRNDQRAELREAALAIGSTTAGCKGLQAKDPLTLRSTLAWFWLHGIEPVIIAPKALLQEAVLLQTFITKANLSEADLSRSNFIGAFLSNADLSHATLIKADLSLAYLNEANLSDANLCEADLGNAILTEANLSGANLCAVNLRGAKLPVANLEAARLIKAQLDKTSFWGARLNKADLSEASLRKADLTWAQLDGANLSGADLGEAILCGTSLRGADLRGARLKDIVLQGDHSTPAIAANESTLWPSDFDETASPLIVIEKG